MNIYPGLFREPKPGEEKSFIDWADELFTAADDDLTVQAIWHPLVRKRLGELLIERAESELLALVPEKEVELYTPIPHKVIVVSSIPPCNFCEDGTPGPYDFATRMGPWANGCERHWKLYRAALGLGTGMGQLWITADQVAPTSAPEAS